MAPPRRRLAAVVAAEFGLSEPSDEIRVFARFVLQIQILVSTSADYLPMLDAAFGILENGWAPYEAAATAE